MSRRLLVVASTSLALCVATPAPCQVSTITNPLIAKRADPYLFLHRDGYYYFTATVPEYDRIELRRATSLQGLSTAPTVVAWSRHSSGAMAAHIWAPELHYIDSKWYIYFAAGSSSNVWDIRVYVLENASANPLDGTWTEKGQLVTNGTTFALDATTFEHQGTRYLVWAEDDPTLEINTALFIAPMTNPWTLKQKGVRISTPDLAWERVGYAVNEGPAVLIRNGKIFIAYSAAATDANYCMGLLTASDTSDLLKASSWTKSPTPVFKSANGIFGPGHNQFTTTPDGTTDLLVYHARDYEKITGDPLNDPNRATRVQPLAWNGDGTPNFASPLRDGTITVGQATGGSGGNTSSSNGGGGTSTRAPVTGGTSGSGAASSARPRASGGATGGTSSPTAMGGAANDNPKTGAGGVTTSKATLAVGATSGRRNAGGADSGVTSNALGGANDPASRASEGGGTRASEARNGSASSTGASRATSANGNVGGEQPQGSGGASAALGASASSVTASEDPTGCSCRSAKPTTSFGPLATWIGALLLLGRSRRRARDRIPARAR
ncbi:MAG: family 43 glycosylhydrolase [Myxococcales bacterium]